MITFLGKNTPLILFRTLGGLFPTITYLLLPYFTTIDITAGVVGLLSITFVVSTFLRFGVDQYILKEGVNDEIGSSTINAIFTQIIILTLAVFGLALFFILSFHFFTESYSVFDNSIYQTVVVALPISISSIGFSFFASQAMKVTSILFFNIIPYCLILLGVMVFDNEVFVLFLSFSIPCIYLLRFISFAAIKNFRYSVFENIQREDLYKIYVVSVLAVLLTNLPVLYAIYIENDELIYTTGVFVRLIGLSSFISTIVYTLFARELRGMTTDLGKQLKIFSASYITLTFGFSLFCMIIVFFSQSFLESGKYFQKSQLTEIGLLAGIILFLPLITIGNIIGYRLLVTNKIYCLIVALGIGNVFLALSYSFQDLVLEQGITMLYFYALILDSIIKIGFYFYNLVRKRI